MHLNHWSDPKVCLGDFLARTVNLFFVVYGPFVNADEMSYFCLCF